MPRSVLVTLVSVLALAAATSLRASDSTDPKAVIEKAIKAMGGEEKLTKYKANRSKGKGKFYALGRPLEFTGEWFMQPPKQLKAVYHMESGGRKVTRIEVINGDKGWITMHDQTEELPADQLAEIHEEMDAGFVATLLPLKGPGYQLSSLGEAKVGNRPVVGVKVSHEAHRDVSLYFDKEKGFLLKMQTRVKDMKGQEVDQETIYDDYQDYGGIKSYKKMTAKRDGKVFLEWEATEYKAVEKLDDSTFAQPGS